MATDLLSQADELLELANHIQNDAVSEQERRAKLDELSKKYHRWYTQAINAFAQDEARKLFEEEYVGSLLSSKISMFLKQGHKIYRIGPAFSKTKAT